MSIRAKCVLMSYQDNPFVVMSLGGHKSKVVVIHVLMQTVGDCRE